MQEELNKRVRSPKHFRPLRYFKHILFVVPFVWRGISRHKQPQYLMGILKVFRKLADEDRLLDSILQDLETAEKLERARK